MDFSDRDEIEVWLRERPREVSVALAARAALRVAPVLLSSLELKTVERRAAIILPAFRAFAVASFAGMWPRHAGEIGAAAVAAASGVVAYELNDVGDAFVGLIGNASLAAAHAADASSALGDLTADSDLAAERRSVDAILAATRPASSAATRTTSLVADTWMIEAQHDDGSDWLQAVAKLSRSPLWLLPDNKHRFLRWNDLKERLLTNDARHEHWHVWTGWYDARLHGTGPWNMELERARILEITNEDWQQGPAHVNRKIMEIEARFVGGRRPAGDRLSINETADRIERQTAPIDKPGLFDSAREKVRRRVERIRARPLANHLAALDDVLDELDPVGDPSVTDSHVVHGSLRAASRMIRRRVRDGLLPEDDDTVDNLLHDVDEGWIDTETASDEVAASSKAYRDERARTPTTEQAAALAKAAEAVAEASSPDLAEEFREDAAEMERQVEKLGENAPIPEIEGRETTSRLNWRLFQILRMRRPTRDGAIKRADEIGKVYKAWEAVSAVGGWLIRWLLWFV